MSATMLQGERPAGGTLFAAVDPSAHHVEGKTGDSRFAALLTPFRSEAEAKGALAAAGAQAANTVPAKRAGGAK
jgi:hypothetical protein